MGFCLAKGSFRDPLFLFFCWKVFSRKDALTLKVFLKIGLGVAVAVWVTFF